jgi:hypothetical protein
MTKEQTAFPFVARFILDRASYVVLTALKDKYFESLKCKSDFLRQKFLVRQIITDLLRIHKKYLLWH